MELRIRWEENSWPTLEAALSRDPVVVLPIGAVEQHGPHLPVGVDATNAEGVALRAAETLRGSEPP
ncbi:MAG TPA: creatininase family protein, partial [Geminicoccaceae bacterium]|nr:creatininase family protein [Geminicoccaceae bacterium]